MRKALRPVSCPQFTARCTPDDSITFSKPVHGRRYAFAARREVLIYDASITPDQRVATQALQRAMRDVASESACKEKRNKRSRAGEASVTPGELRVDTSGMPAARRHGQFRTGTRAPAG